ncbi:MAG: MBL fold metallo-hydrolase [Calditrichia bacterium]
MPQPTFRLRIYGVRGSHPPTRINNTTIGVNTTCLRIDLGPHVIIFDAGTGIVNLGQDLMGEIQGGKSKQNLWKLHILFTHFHIDHLMGFPYFLMNYIPNTQIDFISPRLVNYRLEEVLEQLMSPALFPVTLSELPSTRRFHDFGEGKVVLFFEDSFKIVHLSDAGTEKNWIGKISCSRFYTHPKSGSYTYKIETGSGKSIVFATDVEGFVGGDKRLLKLSEGADILIHDAQYTFDEYAMFQGFGHSTYKMACDIAKEAGVKKLLLFHHDPKHGDELLQELQESARKIFPETYMATESMDFTL